MTISTTIQGTPREPPIRRMSRDQSSAKGGEASFGGLYDMDFSTGGNPGLLSQGTLNASYILTVKTTRVFSGTKKLPETSSKGKSRKHCWSGGRSKNPFEPESLLRPIEEEEKTQGLRVEGHLWFLLTGKYSYQNRRKWQKIPKNAVSLRVMRIPPQFRVKDHPGLYSLAGRKNIGRI